MRRRWLRYWHCRFYGHPLKRDRVIVMFSKGRPVFHPTTHCRCFYVWLDG